MPESPIPLPLTTDPDTTGFWSAARDGHVSICVCTNCGAVLHLPRSHCRNCRSWAVTWRPVAPTARLVSWTIVEHQVHPSFPTPYALVLVELDAAREVRLAGYIEGRPALRAGMTMTAKFAKRNEDVTLVNWVPTQPESVDQEC